MHLFGIEVGNFFLTTSILKKHINTIKFKKYSLRKYWSGKLIKVKTKTY